MNRRKFIWLSASGTTGLLLLSNFPSFGQSNQHHRLSEGFRKAKGPAPYTLWQWMNGCASKEGITSDLEAFKGVGINNVQQFLVGGIESDVTDPEINILNEKWNELFRFSLDECKRLGMDFGTHNCPGWSSSGAPEIKVEESMQELVWGKTTVSGINAQSHVLNTGKVNFDYYIDICLVIVPSGLDVITRNDILVVKDGLTTEGRMRENLPLGNWDILRFGHTTTGHKNLTAPLSGQGFEVDKFSRKALETFWRSFPEKLIELAGAHVGKAFKRFEIDSFEAGIQNWTEDMPELFEERCGYNLLSCLPILAGYTVESSDFTQRFTYDWGATISNLFAAYYRFLEEATHRIPGMELIVEPYGTGKKNFDNLSIRNIGDLIMCEFWNSPATWGWDSVLPVASNAHINGKKIVSAESFTGWPQYAFQTDPYGLKATGDRAFCNGINLFVLHASAHQPWPELKPGMTMGWWGTQFGPSQTWWNHGAREWIEYIKRCQLILQQGLFVADICFLRVSSATVRIPEGFKADICNESELLNRFDVIGGRLCLPDGMSYSILVVPPQCYVKLETAQKIEALILKGATIIGNGFAGAPGLSDFPNSQNKVIKISERLFGKQNINDSLDKKLVRMGKGQVLINYTLDQAIQEVGLDKDFEILGGDDKFLWIHRKDGEEDYYFVSNQADQSKKLSLSFRVARMLPEIWNPETGNITKATVWNSSDGRSIVPLEMEAYGSRFIVFKEKIRQKQQSYSHFTINGEETDLYTYIIEDRHKQMLRLKDIGKYVLLSRNGDRIEKDQTRPPRKIMMDRNWTVNFEPFRGAPERLVFTTLISWSEHPQDGIRYFSGKASYANSFTLDTDNLTQKCVFLDLGVVKNIVTVIINGKEVALKWKPPFTFDITKFCRRGMNTIEVQVTNLWPNRMIGDKNEPEDCKWGPVREFTHVSPNVRVGRNLQMVPDWVKNKTSRPSKNRITFCTMDFFEKDAELLPSGLIGPVSLRIEEVWEIL